MEQADFRPVSFPLSKPKSSKLEFSKPEPLHFFLLSRMIKCDGSGFFVATFQDFGLRRGAKTAGRAFVHYGRVLQMEPNSTKNEEVFKTLSFFVEFARNPVKSSLFSWVRYPAACCGLESRSQTASYEFRSPCDVSSQEPQRVGVALSSGVSNQVSPGGNR